MKNAKHDRVIARYKRGDGFVNLWLHVYDEDDDNDGPGIAGDYCQSRTVMEARNMAEQFQREWKAKRLIFIKKI